MGGVSFNDSQSGDTGNQTAWENDGIGSSGNGSNTSFHNGGQPLNNDDINFFALNPGWASANGLQLGDIGAITYRGKTIYAVYGDNHVGDTPHAEVNVRAAIALKGSPPDNMTGVQFTVYQGTHTQLGDPFTQARIDQLGQQATGGTLPAATGGTAGAGGTGATPGSTTSQSAFQIGDTSNPDEDYWTALNRLGQNAYWYVFSDGQILYIADGYAIMNAQPVARVIQFGDPSVLHMEGTWDNTTWQYASHHKHRGKIQRKSTLAKISSPTQITVDLVCKVDAHRAGQVVQVLGMGPMDGPWLIGDCKRSVFSVFSTLTLVPALQPIPGAQATTGSSTASSTGGAGGAAGGGSGTVMAAVQAAQQLGATAKNDSFVWSPGNRTLTQGGFGPPGTDCSGGVSWILLKAGFPLPGGASWGSSAPVSGDFESWGQGGSGQQMTVWANADHIFMEFNVPGVGHTFFDSGHNYSASSPWWGDDDSGYVSSGSFTPRHWPGT